MIRRVQSSLRSRTNETATINFPAVKWHNSGLDLFFDEIRQAFSYPPDIDQREWGMLQQRWINMAEIIEADETDEKSDEGDGVTADDFTL